MKKSKKRKAYNFGIIAEYIAAIFLWLKGYQVLALRYKNKKGEIDILARKGNTLVVVEVKARQNFSQCADSITPWKQKKILGAVEWLLAGRDKITGLDNINDLNIRFDVIWVVRFRLPQHLQDAKIAIVASGILLRNSFISNMQKRIIHITSHYYFAKYKLEVKNAKKRYKQQTTAKNRNRWSCGSWEINPCGAVAV